MKYKWPIWGNDSAKLQLEQQLSSGPLAHALLFEGPPHVGKRSLARTFAQMLQCPHDFCKQCAVCSQVSRGQHIDTFEFLDEGESFKIESVRKLLSHLSTTTSGRYKIVLIQNVERLTTEATNALLKSIEEPISNVIFLLTSSQKYELLDTLLSRVRCISMTALHEDSMRDFLTEKFPELDDEKKRMVIAFSLGRPGLAKALCEDPERFRFYQDFYMELLRCFESDSIVPRFALVEHVHKDPQAVRIVLELFLYHVRSLLLKKASGESIPLDYATLFGMVEHHQMTRYELKHNVNARLSLENLMLTF